MILRPVYDREGKGRECEPDSFEQVLEHLQQIGGLLRDMQHSVFIFQGCLPEAGEKCMIPDICHQSVSIECGTVCGSIWEMRYILLYVLRRSGEL